MSGGELIKKLVPPLPFVFLIFSLCVDAMRLYDHGAHRRGPFGAASVTPSQLYQRNTQVWKSPFGLGRYPTIGPFHHPGSTKMRWIQLQYANEILATSR
jgi:hypothetical protein